MITYDAHQFWFDISAPEERQWSGTRTLLFGAVFSIFLHITGLGLVWMELLAKGVKIADQPAPSILITISKAGAGKHNGIEQIPDKPDQGIAEENRPIQKIQQHEPVPKKAVHQKKPLPSKKPTVPETKPEPKPVTEQEAKTEPVKTVSETASEAAPVQGSRLPDEERHGSTSSASTVDPISLFTAHVVAVINKHRHYPMAARRRGIEGKTIITFRMDRDGHVSNVALIESAGHRMLDKAAQKTIHAIDGSLRLPDEIEEPWLDFSVPIAFTLY